MLWRFPTAADRRRAGGSSSTTTRSSSRRKGARHERGGSPATSSRSTSQPPHHPPLRRPRHPGRPGASAGRSTGSTGPTMPTSCRTGRSRSRTPTAAASSSSATTGSCARSVAPTSAPTTRRSTLGAVNGDTPLPNGGVLVSEINGSWIDDFSSTGRLVRSFQAPVVLSLGSAAAVAWPDPARGLRRSRSSRDPRPARTGALAVRPDVGLGALDHPSLAIMLPNGDIAINDDYNDRVVIVDPKQRRIVWQYGHLARAAGPWRLSQHAGRDGLRPARPAREAALAARPPSVAHEHTFA